MKIIGESGRIDPADKFRMMSNQCDKLKNHKGDIFDVTAYCKAEDDDGSTTLYLVTSAGTFATASGPVQRMFGALVAAYGEPTEENPIRRVAVVPKSGNGGREYLTLDIAK